MYMNLFSSNSTLYSEYMLGAGGYYCTSIERTHTTSDKKIIVLLVPRRERKTMWHWMPDTKRCSYLYDSIDVSNPVQVQVPGTRTIPVSIDDVQMKKSKK